MSQAIVYTRVSNIAGSRSVADQERECRAVCERHGWPVRAVYTDDGISASRYGAHRPAWQLAKAELRKGDTLVMWEASRAARDMEEFVALRNLCAQLDVRVSYSGRIMNFSNGDDRFVGGMDALMAERESEQIKERVLRGKRTAAADGRPSTRPPWGYRLVRPGVWEFDPVEAPKIREAVRRLLAGDSMKSVLRWLQTLDGFTPSSLTNLQRSLTNPAIAGQRVHQGQIVGKGTWEPLIDERDRKTLIRELRGRQRSGIAVKSGPEPKHLLSGIAKCAKCEQGLRWRKGTGKRNPSYVCDAGHCCRVAAAMDTDVTRELFKVMSSLFASEAFARLRAKHSPNPAADQIDDLHEKIDEWRQAAVRGDVTPASFAQIEKGLLAQIDALEPKATDAAVPLILDPETFEQQWEASPMREKRNLIRGYLDVTVVPAERRGTRTGTVVITPGGSWLRKRDIALSEQTSNA